MGSREKEKAKWVELRVLCPPEVADGVASFMADTLGATGVLFPEGAVSAFFKLPEANDKATLLKGYLASLRKEFPGTPIHLRRRKVPERDWAWGWKKRFKPLRIGRNIVIKPSWEEKFRAHEGDVVIEIDPGQAFGTGAHASTALALEAIEEVLSGEMRPKKCLDAGCGTGILAMAAARLGCGRVLAIDLDPDAVEAAEENVNRNGLGGKVAVRLAVPEEVHGRFGLILANLSRTVLLMLPVEFARLSEPGALLVMSGLLEAQADEVLEEYKARGFRLKARADSGGWSSLVMSAPEKRSLRP